MKKHLFISFIVVLLLVFMSSCSGDCKHSVSDYYSDKYKHWREYTCGCDIEVEMGIHKNDDGDTLCDICGYEVGLKEDKLVYCWYDYKDEYNSQKSISISLDEVDITILVDICNNLKFTKEKPEHFKTKLRYCIRHYDTQNDAFFVNGDEKYLTLTEEFTNEYADVLYTLDFTYSQVKQVYTTPTGEVTKYAKLSPEQLESIKAALKIVSDYFEPKEGTFSLMDFEIFIDELSIEDISMVRIIEENINDSAETKIYKTEEYLVIQSVLANCESMKMETVSADIVKLEDSCKVTIEFTLKDGTLKEFVYYDCFDGDIYTDGERYFKLRNSFSSFKSEMELIEE